MIETIKQLIKIHTSRSPLLDRDAKDAVMHCIFCLFSASRQKELSEEDWNKCICSSGVLLYCWTKDPIEKLKKINGTIYLCTSLSKEAYNKECAIFSEPYRYQYRIRLKENTYGILLNAFHASIHPNEQECLIRLSDVEQYDKIN